MGATSERCQTPFYDRTRINLFHCPTYRGETLNRVI